jgi:hypothetical protein
MNLDIGAFLQTLLLALIAAAVPSLTTLVVLWIKAKIEDLKQNIPYHVLDQIELVADIVVMAAEQSGLAAEAQNLAFDKKAWAMTTGELWLKSQLGLTMDLNKMGDAFWASVKVGLNAAIEARVADMKVNSEELKLCK